MRRILKSGKGFTLIEMVIVIAVIMVLAAVVFISATQYLAGANKGKVTVESIESSFSYAKNTMNATFANLGY